MKKFREPVIFMLLFVAFGILLARLHLDYSCNEEINRIKTEILATEHAPGLVMIDDSVYIVRYYKY